MTTVELMSAQAVVTTAWFAFPVIATGDAPMVVSGAMLNTQELIGCYLVGTLLGAVAGIALDKDEKRTGREHARRYIVACCFGWFVAPVIGRLFLPAMGLADSWEAWMGLSGAIAMSAWQLMPVIRSATVKRAEKEVGSDA